MRASCKDCLHFKKVPGELLIFCKMNRLPQFYDISKHEIRENGIIELDHRESFGLVESCPMFVNMEDDENCTEGQHKDKQAVPVAGCVEEKETVFLNNNFADKGP